VLAAHCLLGGSTVLEQIGAVDAAGRLAGVGAADPATIAGLAIFARVVRAEFTVAQVFGQAAAERLEMQGRPL